MDMLSLCSRPIPPTNWTTWTTIPWKTGVQRRMLENHLSQEHDWASRTNGLFSERPHLFLGEHFWNETLAAAVTRYHVVDAETAECMEYAALMQTYSETEYQKLFEEAEFSTVQTVTASDCPTDEAFAGKLHTVVCRT